MSHGFHSNPAAIPIPHPAPRNGSTASPGELLDVESLRKPGPILPTPHRRAYQGLRFLLRPVFQACFRMDGKGLEHIPQRGPYLLAYNHTSMLDWAFVSYFLPEPVRFVVDREYFDHPLLRIPMRINGAVPAWTDRADPSALRRSRAILIAGEPLVLTPEGRISRTGRPGNGQPGIIALAASARAPILPVAIRGAFESFPRHRRLPRPGRVRVTFGPLLPPPTAADRGTQRALVGRLMHYITALLDGAADPERPW